jgi:hypothetical protein
MSVLLPDIAHAKIGRLRSHSFARFDFLSIPVAFQLVLTYSFSFAMRLILPFSICPQCEWFC